MYINQYWKNFHIYKYVKHNSFYNIFNIQTNFILNDSIYEYIIDNNT